MLKVANSVINASQITGVLPVVNGGTGVTTSTGTGNTVLSAAPTLSGNVSLSTGNLVQGTAAKGFNFTANTPAAGMTSQLLNWYEEGTFTPTIIGTGTAGTATYAPQTGVYTRTGRAVSFAITIIWSGHTGTGNMRVSALPFAGNAAYNFAVALGYVDNVALTAGNILTAYLTDTAIILQQTPTGGGANANVPIDAAGGLMISGTYFV